MVLMVAMVAAETMARVVFRELDLGCGCKDGVGACWRRTLGSTEMKRREPEACSERASCSELVNDGIVNGNLVGSKRVITCQHRLRRWASGCSLQGTCATAVVNNSRLATSEQGASCVAGSAVRSTGVWLVRF